MRILYVYDGNWPRGATRVVKQTRSLSRAGHSVTLICRNQLSEPRRVSEPWMEVRRLPAFGPTRLNYALNFPVFFNPIWFAAIFNAARDIKADCIVVSDLPLAPTALWVGKLTGVPVHYDMAEVYPEFLRGRLAYDELGWSERFIRNPKFAERLEQSVLPRMERIFVVSEESRDRCIRLGVSPDRLILVGNTPENLEAFATGPVPAEIAALGNRRILLFVGILLGDRGIATAIEAMPLLLRDLPDAVLVIVGDGPDRQRLEQLTRSLNLGEHVMILGWKEHSTLNQYYAHAHVGLLPFLDGTHVRITLANKLFDYMAAGLPVLASDLPPMRRIVEECNCGVLVRPDDPPAFARAARELLLNESGRAKMAVAGHQCVITKYNWAQDEQRMLDAVDSTRVQRSAAGTPIAPKR